MRLLPLLLCLALAGCITADAAHDVVPSSAQAAAPQPTAAAKKDEKNDERWKEGGVTPERVSAMCWMKYEQGRRDLPIDQRADLVNKCVADTMKANPPSAGQVR